MVAADTGASNEIFRARFLKQLDTSRHGGRRIGLRALGPVRSLVFHTVSSSSLLQGRDHFGIAEFLSPVERCFTRGSAQVDVRSSGDQSLYNFGLLILGRDSEHQRRQ